MKIPILDLKSQYENLKSEINAAIMQVLQESNFVLGTQVTELEKEIARFCQTGYGVALASGTDALFLSLMALQIGPGDEVITTPFSFIATAEVILNAGARAVFVDIDPETYNIDVTKIERAVTPRTRAIIPVHLFGHPADLDPMIELAKAHNLHLIEDSAQAIGALYKGKPVGSFGDVGCLSFYPTKNLGGYGDGGMVVTSQEALMERVKALRGHGSLRRKYHHEILGYNSRLDTLQAAILLAKLPYLQRWNEARRIVASWYTSKLQGLPVVLPKEAPYARHVYHQYTIRIKERDKLQEHLKLQEIGSMVYYPLSLHRQGAFKSLDYKAGDFPVSEQCEKEVISLPIYPELTERQVERVVEAIRSFVLQTV